MLQRFDVGTIGNVEKTPQGGFRVAAHLTRSGVFHYDDGKGGSVAEYRPLEEVSHADSLATLPDAPVTVGHPGMVTPDNHAQNSTGHVRDVKMDGERIGATVVVQGRKAIKAIEKGVRQVSCGYTCRVDEIPGIAPDGTKYDRVQRGIRYNHVALVEKGRAGDDIRLRLDAAGNQTTREDKMEFELIEGTRYDVGTDAHKAAVVRRDEADKKRKADLDALQAKFDKADADLKSATTKITTLEDPTRLDAAVTARASLIEAARAVCGAEAKFDGKSDAEIRREVAATANPTLKLDGKSEAYVEALFDTAMANADKVRADAAAVGQARKAIVESAREDGNKPDPDKSRAAMEERNRNAWKMPANGAAGK